MVQWNQLLLKKPDLLLDLWLAIRVLLIASAFHRSLESDCLGIALVWGGSSLPVPGASCTQCFLGRSFSSWLNIQETIGFSEIELFLLDQVLDEITFVQLIVGTKTVSGIHDVCLMLLVGNLVSKGFELEWICHMGLLEVLMSIEGAWFLLVLVSPWGLRCCF